MVHTEHYRIRNYETDRWGKLSLFALANHLQDAAERHADRLGVGTAALAASGLAWVLHRMKVTVLRWPERGERIRVETHPSGLEKVYVYRDFRAFDAGGTLLFTASTTWLLFDTTTRRLTPPDDRLAAVFSPYRDLPFLDRASVRFRSLPSENGHSTEVRARFGEMDANAHVNNGVYFQWLPEPLPAGFLADHVCESVEIVFKKECVGGDVLQTTCFLTDDSVVEHRIVNRQGEEVAAARSRWQPRQPVEVL